MNCAFITDNHHNGMLLVQQLKMDKNILANEILAMVLYTCKHLLRFLTFYCLLYALQPPFNLQRTQLNTSDVTIENLRSER